MNRMAQDVITEIKKNEEGDAIQMVGKFKR